jgi:hypothetical protein
MTTSVRCFFHGEELIPDGEHVHCLECGHTYLTDDDLEQAYAEKAPPGVRPMEAARITFCPLCTHDL